MTFWTKKQARALITDSGTLKRRLELAAPARAKWCNLGLAPGPKSPSHTKKRDGWKDLYRACRAVVE